MATKEAKARIKINDLLLKAGWRFEDDEAGKTNISLEHRGKKVKTRNSELGDDFENAPDGFIDYLLLNDLPAQTGGCLAHTQRPENRQC